MKKTKFWLLGALALMFGITGTSASAQAYDRHMCRDYTKTSIINGFHTTGFAQACNRGGGYWDVVQVTGPIELHSYLLGMINDDVMRLGGVQINYSGYSAPPSNVYYTRFTERRVQYVPAPVYYHNNNKRFNNVHSYKNRHHYNKDHRRGDRDHYHGKRRYDRDERHNHHRDHDRRR